MEPLTIKTPTDVLSFVGHTLGFWPQESLVCITLDANRVGATLRVDLPAREGGLSYARTVADYLAHDASAASVLFAVYTSEPPKPGQPKPQAATIAALMCALAERGMTIRDGLLVETNRFPVRRRSPGQSDTAAASDPVQPDQKPNPARCPVPLPWPGHGTPVRSLAPMKPSGPPHGQPRSQPGRRQPLAHHLGGIGPALVERVTIVRDGSMN